MRHPATLHAALNAAASRRLLQGLVHSLVVALTLGCATVAPPAQGADPYGSGARSVDAGPVPPGRVGKLGFASGPVTLVDLRTREAQPATLNWPVTSGDRLNTGPAGRAEVRIGSLAVRVDGDTDVDFIRIDDEVIQIEVRRGSVALRVRNREILPEIDLVTERERIVLDDVGRYRIDVDRADALTAVTVWVGTARVIGARSTFGVRSGQRAEFGGPPGVVVVQPAADTFDDWVAGRDRRDDALVSTRFVSPETTGVEALDLYGSWRAVPRYGMAWFPAAVPVGWAPYRHGRWAFIAPWGWTWIDEAPWGFAPFHYGRWALVGGVWCWVPGAWVARPVFAPALVGWYVPPRIGVTVTIGAVGWFPLGPFEPFVPPYRFDRRHITGINIGHVGDFDYRRVTPPRVFVHQRTPASTWVPDDAILRSEPIRRHVRTAPDETRGFIAGPTPPMELRRERKRSSADVEPAAPDARRGPPGGELRPVPGPATIDSREGDRPVRERRIEPDGHQVAPPGRPSPDRPRAPERDGEFNVRPRPAPAAPPAGVTPPPREFEPGPMRKPMPSLGVPAPAPAPPPARIEPVPRIDRVAPPRVTVPEAAPPRSAPPDFVVRPPARPRAEPPHAQPPAPPERDAPRAEPRRVEPPRGGKIQREE